MNDATIWERFDGAFREMERMLKEGRYTGPPLGGTLRVIHVTTTMTTTSDGTGPTTSFRCGYTEGFDDGWNAREAAGK